MHLRCLCIEVVFASRYIAYMYMSVPNKELFLVAILCLEDSLFYVDYRTFADFTVLSII